MPDLFPPISFFKSNHSRVLFLVSQRCHSIKPPFFPAITPEKFGRQLKKIRLPFGNKGLVSSMLDIQLVDSFFRSDPNPSTSERAGLHFPSAFFGEITLMWLRHNMCFFFHGNPTNWYALHLARCKMHICRWPKNGSHHFLLLLHKLNQQSKPSNFTRNKLDKSCFFFFPERYFHSIPFPSRRDFLRQNGAVFSWCQSGSGLDANPGDYWSLIAWTIDHQWDQRKHRNILYTYMCMTYSAGNNHISQGRICLFAWGCIHIYMGFPLV